MVFSRILWTAAAIAAASSSPLAAQTKGVTHGQRPARLVIRNATIVDGNGTPARGPADIVIVGNKIARHRLSRSGRA